MSNYEIVNDFKVNLDVRKKLGKGVHGTVHPGIHIFSNDHVAAKRTDGIYKEFFSEEEFQKEADLLTRRIPPHENIIKVYDYTTTEYVQDGIPKVDVWLITERCKFGNLKEFAYKRALSIEQKIELMYQSALAISHLHGCKPQSIAHRDVKPENILLTGDEDRPTIKLCDFGSAKAVTRKDGKSQPMCSAAGTRTYEAPEQMELHDGYFVYDKRIDIFSLGITFLAFLKAVKGSPMSPETINGKGLGEMMWISYKNKENFSLPIHDRSDSALESAVKHVIERMIQFEPSDRLSAAEVVEELSKLRAKHRNPHPLPNVAKPPKPAPASKDWQAGTKMLALHSFTATDERGLSFSEFDVLTFVTSTADSSWYQARDQNGNIGLIPSQYVERRGEIELQPIPWFHGHMSQRVAQSLLAGVAIPVTMSRKEKRELISDKEVGTFLVYAMEHEDIDVENHTYTLVVVKHDRRLEFYRIFRNNNNRLTIDLEQDFENLLRLVQFYEMDAKGLCTKLQKALVNESPTFMCVDSWYFWKEGWHINHSDIKFSGMQIPGNFAYTCRGKYFGKDVFIKKRRGPSLVQDILLEAAIMTCLSHKNLVQLIGVCFGDETLIVTEFLGKGTLLNYLRSPGHTGISAKEQIGFAMDVCRGMRHLEQNGIVHGHLAAVSVLLSEGGTAKVGDFVFAHPVGCMKEFHRILIKWSAPEVTKGQRHTPKSDVWSFGILLWEIYSFGCTPYPGIRNNDDVVSHLEDGELMEAPVGCPDEIYGVMLTTWDLRPENRPTFAALVDILDQYHSTFFVWLNQDKARVN